MSGKGGHGRGKRGGRGGRGRGGRGQGNKGRGERSHCQQEDMTQALGAMDIQERPSTAPSTSSSIPQTVSPRSITPESVPSGVQFVPFPLTMEGPPHAATFLPSPTQPVTDVLVIGSTTSSTSLVSGSDLYPPPKPRGGPGTMGRPIQLKINFFEIKIPDNCILNHYRVEIFDERAKGEDRNVLQKHVCQSVWNVFMRRNAKDLDQKFLVYDGRSTLYSRHRLWGGNPVFEDRIEWEDAEDRKHAHLVKIAHTGEVELSLLQRFIGRSKPYETGDTRQREFDLGRSAIQAIEIILSQLPKSRYTTIGRSHYSDPGNQATKLGQGCDTWEGYYQSLRPGQWKPYINIDITNTAIMQDINLVDFICDITNTDRRFPEDALRGRNLIEVKTHLCGLKVSTSHTGRNREYKLNNEKKKVLGENAKEYRFQLSDGTSTTTEKYFLEKYKIRLECPDLPQVQAVKDTTKLPMELCRVVRGQHKRGKLTSDQTSEMIRHAAMPADKRMLKIEDTSKRELVSTPLLKHYGIKSNPNMLEVEGRVLEPPRITYQQNKDLAPKEGSWNLRGVQFKTAMTLDRWVIIDFVGIREDTFYKFLDELRDVGRNCGMMISNPLHYSIPNIHPKDDEFRKISLIEKEFYDLYHKFNPTMFMIFLNEKKPFPLPNKEMYKYVKRICDYELGVLSQCVKDKNIFRANKSTLANICLKMNAKLGGVNHVIDTSKTLFAHLFKKPIMFIGADVNHPHPGMDEVMPSIAAAVGSIDSKLAQYAISVRFQKHSRAVEKKDQPKGAPKKKERLEMIEFFQDMCIELIGAFQNNCRGKLPETIIYYRDGVSEGQFRKVLDKELTALRGACSHFSPDYEPFITIVCVQKRHHLRMFPKNRGDAVGQQNNVPPGCVVDAYVTHPVEFDFYLCSHFGLQGTSKPTHYHVLWDENKFDSNSLQALTYHLCHLYARCTKAVSIPAPVYYAHLVALRAMMSTNFEDDTVSVRSGGSGGSGGSDHIDWDEKRKELKVKTGLMYWA